MFNIKRFSKEISFTSDHTDLTNQNCDKQIALKELPTPMKRCIWVGLSSLKTFIHSLATLLGTDW